jgi:hypothetical protein
MLLEIGPELARVLGYLGTGVLLTVLVLGWWRFRVQGRR